MEERKPLEQLTFREGMQELDSIVALLESNTLELEDSLAQYERGVKLLTMLRGRLNNATQKIEQFRDQLEASPDDETQDSTLS